MILFNLKCNQHHIFEVWFKDSQEFEKQKKKDLISCPICDDKKISKSIMTPNLGKKSNKKNQKTINKTLINKISKYKKIVEENFEYVGDKFTEEAKKMKYGEVDERAIYGEADLKQAKELVDEDIDFQPLPWPSDKKTN